MRGFKTREELVEEFTRMYRAVYGSDADLSPTSPSGQLMLVVVDQLLLVQEAHIMLLETIHGSSPTLEKIAKDNHHDWTAPLRYGKEEEK